MTNKTLMLKIIKKKKKWTYLRGKKLDALLWLWNVYILLCILTRDVTKLCYLLFLLLICFSKSRILHITFIGIRLIVRYYKYYILGRYLFYNNIIITLYTYTSIFHIYLLESSEKKLCINVPNYIIFRA